MLDGTPGISEELRRLAVSFEGGVVLQWVEWPLSNIKYMQSHHPVRRQETANDTDLSVAIFMSPDDQAMSYSK